MPTGYLCTTAWYANSRLIKNEPTAKLSKTSAAMMQSAGLLMWLRVAAVKVLIGASVELPGGMGQEQPADGVDGLGLVNYGEFATAEDAETFGAAALGISRDEYYASLCELADAIE